MVLKTLATSTKGRHRTVEAVTQAVFASLQGIMQRGALPAGRHTAHALSFS